MCPASLGQTPENGSGKQGETVVRSPAGAVRGAEADGIRVFKGIPFAQPPTGELRWKPPVPVPPFEGIRDALEFGPACIQPDRRPGSIYASPFPGMSEDCLSLNIWAPADAEGLPVFVWIHGGSSIWGAGSEPFYEATHLARRSMVVVTINYRLGILGYLAHPLLSAESPDGVSGNYWLLDQIAALEWVRDNISAFGGDPSNVTIAGESAGALSVMYLMTSPHARGLFSRAIAQSAYMKSMPELREERFGEEPAEKAGERFAAAVGAQSVGQLRAMDAPALIAAAMENGFAPYPAIDGHYLPRQAVDVFDRGEQAPVPLIAGYNSGEIRSLRFIAHAPAESAEAYADMIRARYGDLTDDFLALYPPDDLDEAVLDVTRDAVHGWTAERLAVKQTELGQPAYLYLFDHGYPAADDAGLHAFHACEIPYVFGTFDRTPPLWPKVPHTAREKALSEAMADYWASFARSGVPRAAGQCDWPAYGESGAYMHFADRPRAATGLAPGMYRLHEEVVARRRATGTTPWNWNAGIAAPVLPTEDAS